MGNGCSGCFKGYNKGANHWDIEITPRGRSTSISEVATRVLSRRRSLHQAPPGSELLDAVVIDKGIIVRTKRLVPPGAVAKFTKLIIDAHTLAIKAIHSQRTCFSLVYKLCILEQVILEERKAMGDGTFMLEAQQVAMEVIEMIKLFSNRGWLARLNLVEAHDDREHNRLVQVLDDMIARQGVDVNSLPFGGNYGAECTPSSAQLAWHMRQIGGLHTLADKNRTDLRSIVSRLAPLLSINSSAVASLVEEEIKVAATISVPSACNCIRHKDLRLLWWKHLQVEEVSWEEFWACFPDMALADFGSAYCIGDRLAIEELLEGEADRLIFQTAVNKVGRGTHVTTIEIDYVFPPERTLEDSIRLLVRAVLGPMEARMQTVESWVESQSQGPSAGPRPPRPELDEKIHYIQDRAGIPGQGIQLMSRVKEVEGLVQMLQEGRRLIAIVGDCGIGKSAVAAVVADQLMATSSWNHVHYVNLARVETVDKAAALICSAMGIPLFQGSTSNVQRLMNWTKNCGVENSHCAWVLDGIDSLVQLESCQGAFFSLLTQALRHCRGLQLLVTCRQFPELSESQRVEELIHLSRLSEPEGCEIAENLLEGVLNSGDAHYLASACEGIPLGIKLAGGCAASGGVSALSLMTRMRELRQLHVPADLTSEGCSGMLHKLSLECINGLSSSDRTDLLLLSVCPTEFTLQHAAAALDKVEKPLIVWSLLWRLTVCGFLRFIPTNGTYRMEDALVSVVQRLMGETGGQRRRSSFIRTPDGDAATINVEAARAGIMRYHFSTLKTVLAVHKSGAHLSALRMLEHERLGIDQLVLRLSSETVVRMSLTKASAANLFEFVEILCEFLVEVGIHFFNHEQQSAVVEAVFMFMDSQRLKQDQETWCHARVWLVRALLVMGECREAEEALNEVTEGLNAIENKDTNIFKEIQAQATVCQARIKHLGGRFKEAEQLYTAGIALQEVALGIESTEVSETLTNLATVQQSLQKLPQAEKSYCRSLKIRQNHTDKSVVAVTTVLHNLASLNHQQGNVNEAEKLYVKSLSLREQYIGHVNVQVASSLMSLGAVKVAKHDYGEAERLYRRAILILKEILGEDHVAVANASTKLAILLESHGVTEEAGELYVDALEVNEKAFGAVHGHVEKMVSRIRRVLDKTEHPASPVTTNSSYGVSNSVFSWRECFNEMVKRKRNLEDGFTETSSEMQTEWATAVSFGGQTATDFFATAQSLGSAFYETKSSPSPSSSSSYRRPFKMQEDPKIEPFGDTRSPSPTTRTAPLRSALGPRTRANDRYKLPPSPPLRNTSSARALLSNQGCKLDSDSSRTDNECEPVEMVTRRNSDPIAVQTQFLGVDNKFSLLISGRNGPFKSESSSEAEDPPQLDSIHQQESLDPIKNIQGHGIKPENVHVSMERRTSDLDYAAPMPIIGIGLGAQNLAQNLRARNAKLLTKNLGTNQSTAMTDMKKAKEKFEGSQGSWDIRQSDKQSADHGDPQDPGNEMGGNRAFLTLTLEQDLLESTNLYPEHMGAHQSIVNPLFTDQTESHQGDSPGGSGTLVNTHASFHL